jgi:hypothetical protein
VLRISVPPDQVVKDVGPLKLVHQDATISISGSSSTAFQRCARLSRLTPAFTTGRSSIAPAAVWCNALLGGSKWMMLQPILDSCQCRAAVWPDIVTNDPRNGIEMNVGCVMAAEGLSRIAPDRDDHAWP